MDFSMKYRLRKTDEDVEVIAWETADKGARNESDWVSYIDANGVEHVKEHLTLEWDFKIQTPFENILAGGFGNGLDKYDPWEGRRYELVKSIFFDQEVSLDDAVVIADEVIARLKPKKE